MLQIINEFPNILYLKAKNNILKSDLESITTLLDLKIKEEGRLSLYLLLEDVSDIEAGAFWEDFKFGLFHLNDFDKVAVVGDEMWMKWIRNFGKLFAAPIEVNYYNTSNNEKALKWIQKEPAHTSA